MALKIGDKAPDFTLSSKQADGIKLIKLSDNFGKTNTLLLFVPMAFTGVCTKEFCDVTAGLSAYTALNASVLGISGDSPFAQEQWAQKEKIQLPLLSDYEHKVAAAYGCAYDSFLPAKNLPMGGVPKRSAFVVDKGGVIRYAEIKESAGDLPNFDAIKACLATLK
ncbi:MAG: redoxin domain-containing protein [Verrucomicrobiota bacterium]